MVVARFELGAFTLMLGQKSRALAGALFVAEAGEVMPLVRGRAV
jgi:hypothetical protein